MLKDELETAFTEIKEQPKKQVRLTRTEQKKQKDKELDDIIKQEEEKDAAESNPGLDLFDPVDLLAKFNGDWIEKIGELKVWKEKKDMLDELFNDSNVPKIKAGDYSGIVKVLKKMINDANIVVSQTAVKVCGNLAKGLKGDFE